jgi:ribosomal protein S18 acetylase RimI-like enzyme
MDTVDDFVVRDATEVDLPAVARRAAALVRLHHAWDPARFFLEEPIEHGYCAFLGRMLGDRDTVILVAVRGDAVLGYGYARLEPRDWNALLDACGMIHDVFVDAAARGRGVGERLVSALCARLADRGAPRVVLTSAWDNREAQALFQRLGFRRTMVEMTREAPPRLIDDPTARPKGG